MADCCSSSTGSSPLVLGLPPFADRFLDIPEPARSLVIGASVRAIWQNLESTAGRIKALDDAVHAAEVVGIGVGEYKALVRRLEAEQKLIDEFGEVIDEPGYCTETEEKQMHGD